MSEKFQLKGSIYDIKFVYNSKLEGYTTSMSHMNELSEMPDAPRLGIEGENNGIGGIPKRK